MRPVLSIPATEACEDVPAKRFVHQEKDLIVGYAWNFQDEFNLQIQLYICG